MKVAIVLATGMAERYLIETPVFQVLSEQEDLHVAFLTLHESNKEKIVSQSPRFEWKNLHRPADTPTHPPHIADRLRASIYKAALFWFRRMVGYAMLAYRFNEMHGFTGHQQKKKYRIRRKIREIGAGNYVFPILGFPFPRSQAIFNLLYKLFYCAWDYDPYVETFFKEFSPDLVYIAYPQRISTRPYLLSAWHHDVPVLVYPGSWDRLTTKGPMPPEVEGFVVLNHIMQCELIDYHGVSEEKITIVGWPQLDLYKAPEIIQERSVFLGKLGIDPQHRILVYAANTPRIGQYEQAIVRYLSQNVAANKYGADLTLVVRPHPKDEQWKERFGEATACPNVILQSPQFGQLGELVNLLYHASAAISVQGSITVDSIAMDTPIINIAFDGDHSAGPTESFKQLYDLDHFRSVTDSGAISIVESYQELDQEIQLCLHDPTYKAKERQQLRQILLEPFDGHASRRLVEQLLKYSRETAVD